MIISQNQTGYQYLKFGTMQLQLSVDKRWLAYTIRPREPAIHRNHKVTIVIEKNFSVAESVLVQFIIYV